MRRIATKIVFLISFLAINASILSIPLTFLFFKINQDYIARTQCDYRNLSITVCAGSCVYERKLKLLEDFQVPADNRSNSLTVVAPTLYFEPVHSFELSSDLLGLADQIVLFHDTKPQGHLDDIFHPPQRKIT